MGTVVFASPRLGVPYFEFAGTDEFLRSWPMPGAQSLGFQKMPSDPLGSCVCTFTGVKAGSEVRVYRVLDGAAMAGVETCVADNPGLTFTVYAASAQVRIVIIHPSYKIKEFEYTPAVGTTSLPVQQEADKWYSNPV